MIFIDSSFFISLFFEEDRNHILALKTWGTITKETSTSEDVLKETLTILSQRKGKRSCIDAYQKIQDEIILIPSDTQYFQTGLQLFLDPRLQKDISLTDCITVAVCKKLNIKNILTFDRHFLSFGVKMLPR